MVLVLAGCAAACVSGAPPSHGGRDADDKPTPGGPSAGLTPLTSILVLESMADYGRWGLATPERPDDKADPRLAKSVGILGLLKAPAREELSALFTRDLASGNDGSNSVLGGRVADQIGEANGVGGLGLAGTGSGGGGTGEGTIGLGNFGTIGKGGGGNGSGYGRGVGDSGRGRAYEVIPGPALVRGSLDKEIVRRIVRRHMMEVKYCYEQELFRHPALAGRIAVQFTIGSTGQVISSVLQSSTIDNGPVESCLVQAVRRWEYPRPFSGGIAIVSIPFNFTPHGDATTGGIPAAVRRTSAPIAPDPFTKALRALRGKEELSERLANVALIMGAPATHSRSVLAWWIVEQYLRSGQAVVTGACVLAANLLRDANLPHEAARILSEAGEVDRPAVTAEFRRWGRGPDVKRLTELARRK